MALETVVTHKSSVRPTVREGVVFVNPGAEQEWRGDTNSAIIRAGEDGSKGKIQVFEAAGIPVEMAGIKSGDDLRAAWAREAISRSPAPVKKGAESGYAGMAAGSTYGGTGEPGYGRTKI